ncbi:MAG: hypothetical protein AABX01_08075 [Candidatus Micrarchaeota archaeon]
MTIEDDDALLAEVKKIIQEKIGEKEYCIFLAVEVGEKGSGDCFLSTFTSLSKVSPMGSWKGILYSVNRMYAGLSDNYLNFSSLQTRPPFEPKQ